MSSTPANRLSAYRLVLPRPDGSAEREGPTQPLSLVGLECSFDTATLDQLESIVRSFPLEVLPPLFERHSGTEEVGLLTTCHRVELVLLLRDPAGVDRWLADLPGPQSVWRLRDGRELVRHLFRVATGRESLARGELEVSQQVRAAGFRVLSRHPRPVLREVLQGAASTAQELASGEAPPQSIASMAVTYLRTLLAAPSARVLVVGSGTVGRQVARCLSPDIRATLVYHTRPPSDEFLRNIGVDAAPMDRLGSLAANADAIVTAAKFGHHGIRAADLPPDRPMILVDLGMPRNIDPAVRQRPGIRLVDLEELHAWSRDPRAPSRPDARVQELADRFSGRIERLLLEPWIDALYRTAEATRRAEVERARKFLGPLDADQEAAIDRLTRRLVAQLLAPSTERIRSLPAGPAGDLERRLAVELLRPAPSEP